MPRRRKVSTPPPANYTHKPILCIVVVILSVWLTFGRTLGHEFVGGWDDGPLITDNALVNPPTMQGLGAIWTQPHARMYIPAVYTTWWMLAKVGTVPYHEQPELNPFVFHAANVLVHTVSALLVFALLRKLVRRDWPAVAGAVLFAIHPLQVEPVAWATGMKDLLGGMLSLAAMWLYMEFTTSTTTKHRRIQIALATVCFMAALLAKPSAVVTPFILVTIECLMLCRPIGRAVGVLLPWMALALGWMIVTAIAQPTPEIAAPSIAQRLIIAANALGFYIVKLFWPMRLGIDYGLRPEVLARATYFLATLAAAIAVILARKRWLTASAAVFAVALAPTLGLKPFVFQWVSTVADRYAYLALLGPAILLSVLLCEWRVKPAAWITTAVLVALALLSNAQARAWKDNRTLMTRALLVNPNSAPANAQIGDHLIREGKISEAHTHFLRAVQTSPTYLVARDNLAGTLAVLKRYDEALTLMQETLAMKQALPEAIRQSTARDEELIARVQKLKAASTAPAAR